VLYGQKSIKDTARHILHHLMTVGENAVQEKRFEVMSIGY